MRGRKGSLEKRALLQRYTGELNAQEDQLAALLAEIAQFEGERTAKDAEFQAKVNAISIDEAL